jgi:LPXTG-site transpeptidase (sortase) family protein
MGPPPAVRLVGSEFAFLDPPEPGARAHLTVMVDSDEATISPPVALAIAARWFDGYRLEMSSPPLLADFPGPDGRRRLVLAGLSPGVTTLGFDLLSTAEGLEPPDVRLETAAGSPVGAQPGIALGRAQPPTAAPKPRPGPVMALRIPHIGVSSAVVPTAWEPPPFLVGQLRESASITLGNTVLVGHLTGAAGSVFGHLDQLEAGDEIVAVSRGLEYTFTVSATWVGPGDDSSPLAATTTPRLTLMTCTGTWDPIGREYSDRLWVVAEPADPR